MSQTQAISFEMLLRYHTGDASRTISNRRASRVVEEYSSITKAAVAVDEEIEVDVKKFFHFVATDPVTVRVARGAGSVDLPVTGFFSFLIDEDDTDGATVTIINSGEAAIPVTYIFA